MIRSALRPLLALGALGAVAAGSPASPAPQGLVGPFQGGQRWVHAAGLQAPFIPTRVRFAARGELVWAAGEVANPRLMLLDGSGSGVVQPSLLDTSVAGASDILAVEAGPRADRLFALQQVPEPDLFSRRTLLTRHDALAAGGGSPFAPAWTHSLDFLANGGALLGIDALGERAALAAVNDGAGVVRVELVDTSTGTVLFSLDLAGTGLEALALSADGRRIAVGVGARLVVLDDQGVSLHDELLGGTIGDLALDHDGSRLVAGSVGALQVYDQMGSVYAPVAVHTGGSAELASLVAIDADGGTYACSWWRFLDPDALRCEVYDGATHGLLNLLSQPGQAGGPQNAPAGLVMTADGERIAFAAWGRGDGAPEVVLLQRGQAAPVLEVDLPGSALGVDLDSRGRRVAVVTKNLHANQVGSTGEVRLYDTGERDLELLQPARLGGELRAASLLSGAQTTLFLVGPRAVVPAPIGGVSGLLALDRDQRLRIFPALPDQAGRADLSLAIPALPALAGVPYALQAANRVGGSWVLSSSVADPLFY